MKQRHIAFGSSFVIFALVSAAFGAEEQAPPAPSIAAWFVLLSPVVLIIVFLVVLARKSGAMKQGGYMAKANAHMDLSVEHMASIERKTDRMIELLESIDRKLGERA
jgi:hypothetical protein